MSTLFFQLRIPTTLSVPALPEVEYGGHKTHLPGVRMFASQKPLRLTEFLNTLHSAYRLFPVSGEFDTTRRLARFNMDVAEGYRGFIGEDFWNLTAKVAWAVEIYNNPDSTVAVVLSNPVSLYTTADIPVMVMNQTGKGLIWQGDKFQSLVYTSEGHYLLQ